MALKSRFGKGKAWLKNGVYVLSLKGTRTEMAAQHGALMREEIQNGAMPFLGRKNAALIEHSHLFEKRPVMAKAMKELLRLTLDKPMLAHVPRVFMEEIRALCRESGLSYETCLKSIVQADSLVLLLRFFLGRHLLKQLGGGFPGCTSIVSTGRASATGEVIHARNMDYPVVGKWDVYPTVFYCDPEGIDKGQRFIGVSTAGVHAPGITGLNESGLTISTHFHCAKAVSPFGTPIQFIVSDVIRRATSISQAIDVAQSYDRAGTWSFILSSAKENNAVAVEMTHGKIAVREPTEGLLAHSNHFHTQDFLAKEIMFSASVACDYAQRYSRAMQLMQQSAGQITRETFARILADHFDQETGKLRSQGNTVSVITTVTSMISEASKGLFHVANRGEAPVCLGDYLTLETDENFDGFDDREPALFAWSPGNSPTIRGTRKESAFRHFRDCYVSFHVDFDLENAARHAERAAEADPEEGHFHLADGHFKMRLRRPEQALAAFKNAQACVLSGHMRQVAELFTAHALDCLGRRDEAKALYQKTALALDPGVRKEAAKCLKKPYTIERAGKITFDLQFCDSFEYA